MPKYEYRYIDRYNDEKDRDIICFLIENNIEYRIKNTWGNKPGHNWLEFSLSSTNEKWKYYVDTLQKFKRNYATKDIVYSSSEYKDAKWLWVMPKRNSIDIVNEEAFRYFCERENAWGEKLMTHVEQTGNITIRKVPNLSTSTAFWASTTGFAELYTDYRVKKIAQINDLKGLELLEVKLRNGSYSDKIYQMMTRDRLRREVIGKGYGEKIIKCPVCGKEQYGIDSSYQLRMDLNKVSEERDFYMTEDIFGEGFAHPLYVISQRFYRILKENKLVGGVNFNPVANVDPC